MGVLTRIGFSSGGPGAAAPGGVSGVSPEILSPPAPEGSALKKPIAERPTTRPPNPSVGRKRLPFVAQGILLAFLLGYLGVQAWTYGLADAAATFQSPFCLEAPANNGPTITYMQSRHITRAWAPNLLGYPIVFKTNGSIIIANPLALTNPPQAINRIPAYTSAVQQADRPSFLVFAGHDDQHPAILKMLDDEGVTYQAARFPAEPGFDVLVVTPVNRTVSPLESKAFNGFFICRE